MKFLNRTEELKRITNSLFKGNSLVILYGRRRIGKSAILQQVIKESDIYYLADLQDESLQKNELAQEIGLKINEFNSVIYPDWKSIFTHLNERKFYSQCAFLENFVPFCNFLAQLKVAH